MKQNKNKGFTVIESLIFLAVSGVLFLSVALMISGQTSRYQARDAVNQVESVMRGVFKDVSNGYYPLVNTQFVCSVPGGATRPTVTPDTAGENRGTHNGPTGCIIAGKSIELQSNKIIIHTLVANGDTTAVPSDPSSQLTTVNELDETKNYKWGLDYYDGPQQIYVLYTKFGPVIDVDNFVSGAQSVSLFEYTGTPPSLTRNAVTASNNNSKLCFKNGDNKSSLLIADYSLDIEANYIDNGCPP